MIEDRDLQNRISRRDDLIIWLAQHLSEAHAKAALRMYDEISEIHTARSAATLNHKLTLNRLLNEESRIRANCTHMLTWHDNGGQYTKASTYCSICGAEL